MKKLSPVDRLPHRQRPEGKDNIALVEKFLKMNERYCEVSHDPKRKPHNVYHCMREAVKAVNASLGRQAVHALLRQEHVFLENLDLINKGDDKA